MAAEEINQTVVTETPKEDSRSNERITQLSEKVKTEAEARIAAENKAAEAERKAAFAEGYADFALNNPAAKEYKQQIQEKVLAGMSVEDAGFAILGKEGKLGVNLQPIVQSPVGGSATTNVPQATDKSVAQMTQAERRAALMERVGELENILAPRSGV